MNLLKRIHCNFMARLHKVNAQLLLEQGAPVMSATQELFASQYETRLYGLRLNK